MRLVVTGLAAALAFGACTAGQTAVPTGYGRPVRCEEPQASTVTDLAWLPDSTGVVALGMTLDDSEGILRLVDPVSLESEYMAVDGRIDPLAGVAIDSRGSVYWFADGAQQVRATSGGQTSVIGNAPAGGLSHLGVLGDDLVGYSHLTNDGAVVKFEGGDWLPIFQAPIGEVVTGLAASRAGSLIVEYGPEGGGRATFVAMIGPTRTKITPVGRLVGGPTPLTTERAFLFEDHDVGSVVKVDVDTKEQTTELDVEAFTIVVDDSGKLLAFAQVDDPQRGSRVCITELPPD
jgi:hypothetical protein